MPKVGLDTDKDAPAPYNKMQVTQQEAIRQCVESAGRSLVVLSGGNKASDAEVLDMTKLVMKAGGSGVIYGRNIWQRKPGPAKKIVSQIGDTLVKNVIRTP
jgi:class I fructose-bisphosphate aldolase